MFTYKYQMPALTADVVVTYNGKVLLIKRGPDSDSFPNYFALPGGFMNINETLEQAACRELKEETGIELCELDLTPIGIYSEVDRDPRQRVITSAYYHMFPVRPEVKAGDDAVDYAWASVIDIVSGKLKLAFDHNKIVYDYYMGTIS